MYKCLNALHKHTDTVAHICKCVSTFQYFGVRFSVLEKKWVKPYFISYSYLKTISWKTLLLASYGCNSLFVLAT